MRYFTTKIFSGAIFGNTMEAYGQNEHVNDHRKAFGRLKGAVVDMSLPPSIDTKYPDVWPNSPQHAVGTTLLISTKVSDVLITLSLLLDARLKPYAGSINMSFRL
ncbi:hypothetical protein CLU79DRAFT_830121 [Phycomyces nitens]|nr:hypothetical protein CLU79DRAFT_830121 [Phycomyces nitens]